MKRRIILGIVLICFVSVFVSGLAGAKTKKKGYPNKPIDLIVPYNPGGGTDVTARILSSPPENNPTPLAITRSPQKYNEGRSK